jgi:hypothetical protein
VLVHVLDVLLVHVRVRMGVIVVGVFMLVLDVLVVVLDVCVGVFHVPVRVLVGVRQIGHRIAPIVVNTWHCIHIVSHRHRDGWRIPEMIHVEGGSSRNLVSCWILATGEAAQLFSLWRVHVHQLGQCLVRTRGSSRATAW